MSAPEPVGAQSELARELQHMPVLQRAMLGTLGVVIVLALAAVIWIARIPILLAFAGILLAIVLHGSSRFISDLTGIPRLMALVLVVLLLAAAIVSIGFSAGPTIVVQTTELAKGLGTGFANLMQQVLHLQPNSVFQASNISDFLNRLQPWGIASGATAFAGNVAGVIAGLLIVLFFGIYVAADPEVHVRLLSLLAPERDRETARALIEETGDVLRRWLIGQAISMAVIGGFTYIGLLILGVPIAFVLALFAGLAGFLPYLGPIIGAVPMVLVAGGDSLDLALYVLVLYVVVQSLESYLLTPLIQSRAVSLPPAVVILNQLVLGAIFGLLGIALATPLAAAATVPLRYWFGPTPVDRDAEPDRAKPKHA
jgi:predicted PurR-regulated permease PerM